MIKYWLLLLLITFLLYAYGEDEGDVTVSDEEENITTFIPTNQWQQLAPGQAVPAGLHVRINLQTGEKEAKLIEEESEDGKMGDRRRLHHYGYSDRRGIINKQTRAFKVEELIETSHEDNKDIKLLTYETTTGHDVVNDKVLSYKSGLATDDVKQIMKFVGVLRDNSSSLDELIFALSELEYLVHQVDNARDLDIIGGLELVVFLLEHTNDTVQCNAAHVIGAAAQSNQIVQEACLKYNALNYLTMIIATLDKTELLYRRTVYALSALLRLNNEALYNFTFVHRGFDIISGTQLKQRCNRYQLKIVTLIIDLLSEQAEKYDPSGEVRWLLNYLTTSGWCGVMSHLLPSNCIEHNFLLCDAIVQAMLLLENCNYANNIELLEKVKDQFAHYKLDDGTYSEGYNNVVKLLDRITEQQT